MVEQPKLLHRPLPLKLLSKPSTPRENVCEDFNDAPDGNSMEDVWETNFYFIASKQDEEVKLIPGSQVEVLCYFLCQKFALSLQAYFLFHLPDLTSLIDTLVYLNLSFDSFFPTEVFNIKTLQVLVLWNNSISEIPNDIHRLKSLKKFTISFNLLSHLPSGLFSVEDLQYLDIACNDTSFIPNGIKNLRCLFRFGRLPFYFHACSSSCRRNFMSQTEA